MGLHFGKSEDLAKTDQIAKTVLEGLIDESSPSISQQLADNIRWIEQAGHNNLVVGTQARILYLMILVEGKLP